MLRWLIQKVNLIIILFVYLPAMRHNSPQHIACWRWSSDLRGDTLFASDSFEYTPGIVKRIVHPDRSSTMRVRHDAYVQNGKVIIGYAEDICNDAHSVQVNGDTVCQFF